MKGPVLQQMQKPLQTKPWNKQQHEHDRIVFMVVAIFCNGGSVDSSSSGSGICGRNNCAVAAVAAIAAAAAVALVVVKLMLSLV